jgi:hypothetical protein
MMGRGTKRKEQPRKPWSSPSSKMLGRLLWNEKFNDVYIKAVTTSCP